MGESDPTSFSREERLCDPSAPAGALRSQSLPSRLNLFRQFPTAQALVFAREQGVTAIGRAGHLEDFRIVAGAAIDQLAGVQVPQADAVAGVGGRALRGPHSFRRERLVAVARQTHAPALQPPA